MKVSTIVASITDEEIEKYTKYWKLLKPITHQQISNCFIFAFLSIRTTWRKNVHGFELWGNDKIINIVKAVHNTPDEDPTKEAKVRTLNAMVAALQTGLQGQKLSSVQSFLELTKDDFNAVLKKEDESWDTYRNRISDAIRYLGITKSSFAIELLYPDEAGVVCIDTRMVNMFGYKGMHLGPKKYREIEKEWVAYSETRGVAPAIARHIVWSRESPSGNCTDWSNCLDTAGTASAIFA